MLGFLVSAFVHNQRFTVECCSNTLETIQQFNNQPPLTSSNLNKYPEYSKEGFIEAIVEFIVGDDQVYIYHLTYYSI